MGWFDRWFKRKPLPSPQESVSEAQMVPPNWASSQPYLALLEKFLSAREVKDWFLESWAPAFGTDTQRVIDGLIAHGALELAPTVADLKVMLSSRGLKVSGKKAELIQRLLEADPKGMEVKYAHRMILRCTPAASQAVSRWKSECESAYEIAADNVIAALRNRDFKEAICVADVYRKNKFEPPIHPGVAAMMITPAPRSIEERANDFATVFTMRPKILRELKPEQWEGLYLNYAVGELLGRTAPEKCMPGFTGVGIMDSATATRMLSFYVKHQSDLARSRELGIKKVKIIGIGGCEACSALNNKIFLFDELPELPYEKCTCDLGCRCTTRAVLSWPNE
jgi:hypothetical protein